jgi:hypothetical protein
MSANVTTIAAKVPTVLAARLDELARRRRLTLSLLIRGMAERELDADQSEQSGPIEATTRARLEQILDPDALDPRASVACELARRFDVDPSNGAQHSRELMRLLDDLEREARAEEDVPDVLAELQARRVLRQAGYGITDPHGTVLATPEPAAASVLLDKRERRRHRRERILSAIQVEDL